MDATTPPTDPSRRERRAQVMARAAPPRTQMKLLLWLFGGLLVLGGGVTAALVALSDRQVQHERALQIPASAPVGEPIHVEHAVKPGDVFVSTVVSKSRLVLTTDDRVDASGGMEFNVKLTVGHGIEKGASPAGTASTVRVFVERADSTLSDMKNAVWFSLGMRATPYGLTFERDAQNRPDRATVSASDTAEGVRRHMLDFVLAGLGDLSTNYLPNRDVRRGEVWDLSEAADVVPSLERVIREIAQRKASTEGFPPVTIVAKAQAQDLEDKAPVEIEYARIDPKEAAAAPVKPPPASPAKAQEAEPCLRLALYITVAMQGETNEPKLGPGWISTAARITGPVWVSRSTGIVWAVDLTGDVISTYRATRRPTEIKATMRIVSTTERAKKMPV
jgi:hypothetical protein